MEYEKIIAELQRKRDRWLEYGQVCRKHFESKVSPAQISNGVQDVNSVRCAGVIMGLNMAIEAIKEQLEEEINESDNH